MYRLKQMRHKNNAHHKYTNPLFNRLSSYSFTTQKDTFICIIACYLVYRHEVFIKILGGFQVYLFTQPVTIVLNTTYGEVH